MGIMIKKGTRTAALGMLAAATIGLSGAAGAATWSDASIGYRYGTGYMEPGSPNDVVKHILNFTWVGGYKYGVNFFTVDMLHSNDKNPAIGGTTRGAHEIYAIYNNTISMSALKGSDVKFGPFKDIGFQAGFDYNSKNDAFGAGLYKIILGPKLTVDAPGLLQTGLFAVKEYNNNGIVGGNVNFDTAWRWGTVWGFNFNAGLPAVFKGFVNFTGPKGKDGFGGQTKTETLLNAALMWDVGAAAGMKDTVYAGFGVEYWKNKFGNNAAVLAGSKYTTGTFNIEVKF